MHLPFHFFHTIKILQELEKSPLPMDLFLRNYCKKNKAIGSKDRKKIYESLYHVIRWKGLIEHLSPQTATWRELLENFYSLPIDSYQNNPHIPPHAQCSFPKWLFDKFCSIFGPEKAKEICLVSNTKAPVTIRANLLKTTREKLLPLFKKDSYALGTLSPDAICFFENMQFANLDAYQQGLFEIQDESSQKGASLLQPKETDLVLDFCAGSGGKTLAFAPQMNNKGQIFLYDKRPHILQDAKKRLRKAGIQNAQCVTDIKKLSPLKGKIDSLLLDVPCSGTGTLRRNPDMKWKLTPSQIENLTIEQKNIFEEAFPYVKPGGKIVYLTCSILPEENEKQIEYFLKTYPLTLEIPYFSTLPKGGLSDGFFGAILKKSLPS